MNPVPYFAYGTTQKGFVHHRRLADLLGRRRLFMSGLVLFALASLAGGLAPAPAC